MTLAVDGAMWPAWAAVAGLRAGTCVAAGVLVAVGLYPLNLLVLRWTYRPGRTRTPERLAWAVVVVVLVATLIGLAESAVVHLD